MGKTKGQRKVKVNLVEIIRQAAPQVWGSDEREMLYNWLARNTENQQMVEIDVRSVLVQPNHRKEHSI